MVTTITRDEIIIRTKDHIEVISQDGKIDKMNAGKAHAIMIIEITGIIQIGKEIERILTIQVAEIQYRITADMNIGTVKKTESLGFRIQRAEGVPVQRTKN